MDETLTGKQVLALLAQDDVPEIESGHATVEDWCTAPLHTLTVEWMRTTNCRFRIKPKPPRRLSVTLANGEVVSWPEPVREALKDGEEYYLVFYSGEVEDLDWHSDRTDKGILAFGNVHLTREAAQEHADALRRINTQGVA